MKEFKHIEPKPGERYRVIKKFDTDNYVFGWGGESAFGNTIECVENHTFKAVDFTLHKTSKNEQYVYGRYLTTEYLEKVESSISELHAIAMHEQLRDKQKEFDTHARFWIQTQQMQAGKVTTTKQYCDALKAGPYEEPYEELTKKTNKYTTMKKITSALKRFLSEDQQALYKTNYIDEGLELSKSGQAAYVSALYRNEGDHAKAVAEMVEQAKEELEEEKD